MPAKVKIKAKGYYRQMYADKTHLIHIDEEPLEIPPMAHQLINNMHHYFMNVLLSAAIKDTMMYLSLRTRLYRILSVAESVFATEGPNIMDERLIMFIRNKYQATVDIGNKVFDFRKEKADAVKLINMIDELSNQR